MTVINTDIDTPDLLDPDIPYVNDLVKYTLSSFQYEWALAGQPFVGVASDEFPLVRGFAVATKDQFDNQVDPGEQSLQGWWLRAQRDFSGGAGITYFEPSSDERTMRRFKDSYGLDVWTPGEITLLRSMADSKQTFSAPVRCVSVVSGSTNYAYFTTGSKVYRVSSAGTETEITGWTATPTWLVSTGDGVFGFHSTGIDYSAASGTTAGSLWTGAGSAGKGWWVKQRLIAAYGSALYELGGFSGGSLPSALYTHPQSGWVWTAVVDTPGAILAAGYAGASSAIYKFTVDEADGTLPTLTSAVTVAELPIGEYVTGMFSYLGTYVVLGTNKGVRIGQVSDTGQVAYGPLTYESSTPVEFICGWDRFVYVGATQAVTNYAGVVRIDLSDLDATGRGAWANDVSTLVTSSVSGVCMLGSTDRVCVGLGGTPGFFATNATQRATTGKLWTGQVRFNTLENKSFRFLNVRRQGDLFGTMNVYAVQSSGTESTIGFFAQNTPSSELVVVPKTPIESLGFAFVLNRSSTDATKGPTVRGWQAKALPAIERKRTWRLPLMCWDTDVDRFGNKTGGPGFALTRWQALRNALLDGLPVALQDFSAGEAYVVLIEDIQMVQTSPPRQQSGLGGVLVVTCREL